MKNRKKQNSVREELPLRGLLYCSRCNNKITGSASRSKTGARHFYYHCNHCKQERFRAETANQSILNFLDELKFNDTAVSVYTDIVVDMLQNTDNKEKVDVGAIKEQIQKLEVRRDKLQDLLLDEVIGVEDYTRKCSVLDKEIQNLKQIIQNEKSLDTSTKSRIAKSINLFANAKSIYLKASIIEKQKLLSSIFPENLHFSNLKCRTQRINSLLGIILLISKDMTDKKKGQLVENLELSHQVDLPGQFSNTFIEDLSILASLSA